MNTISILIIPANPDTPLTWERVKRGLATFQGIVGGDVQVIPIGDGVDLWCNEDTRGRGLPANARATRLYLLAGGIRGADVDGDAFLTGGVDDAGETLGLSLAQAERLDLSAPVTP